MFNILTDGLPTEYEGYLINPEFFNGIFISECLKDRNNLFGNDDYSKIQKIYTAFTMLYGNGIPPFEVALKGLKWFLNCGNEEEDNSNKDNKEYFDFLIDAPRIYSAFKVKYNINLATEKKLHWFEFIYLFNDLNKTAFREVVNIRMMKPSEYKHYGKEAIAEIKRQKRKFELNKVNLEKDYTPEQNKLIDEFYNLIGGENNVRI